MCIIYGPICSTSICMCHRHHMVRRNQWKVHIFIIKKTAWLLDSISRHRWGRGVGRWVIHQGLSSGSQLGFLGRRPRRTWNLQVSSDERLVRWPDLYNSLGGQQDCRVGRSRSRIEPTRQDCGLERTTRPAPLEAWETAVKQSGEHWGKYSMCLTAVWRMTSWISNFAHIQVGIIVVHWKTARVDVPRAVFFF